MSLSAAFWANDFAVLGAKVLAKEIKELQEMVDDILTLLLGTTEISTKLR